MAKFAYGQFAETVCRDMNKLSTVGMDDHPPRTNNKDRHLPAWFDDFGNALAYASQIVCTGNTGDLFPDPDGSADKFSSFEETVWRLLSGKGVQALLIFDPICGLRLSDQCDASAAKVLAGAGIGRCQVEALERSI
jgi:hypothetical protein